MSRKEHDGNENKLKNEDREKKRVDKSNLAKDVAKIKNITDVQAVLQSMLLILGD